MFQYVTHPDAGTKQYQQRETKKQHCMLGMVVIIYLSIIKEEGSQNQNPVSLHLSSLCFFDVLNYTVLPAPEKC